MEDADESGVCEAIGVLSRHEDPRLEWAIDKLLRLRGLVKIDNEGLGNCLFAAFFDAREDASSDGSQRQYQILTARLDAVEWIRRKYETGDIPQIREAIEACVSAWYLDEEVDNETGEKKSKEKPAESELGDVQYYCSKLMIEGEKGGEAEILGLAHHYDTAIVIIDYASGQYIVIRPGDETRPMSRVHYELEDGFYPPDDSIVLAHVWNRQHYVAIRRMKEVRVRSVLVSVLCASLLWLGVTFCSPFSSAEFPSLFEKVSAPEPSTATASSSNAADASVVSINSGSAVQFPTARRFSFDQSDKNTTSDPVNATDEAEKLEGQTPPFASTHVVTEVVSSELLAFLQFR